MEDQSRDLASLSFFSPFLQSEQPGVSISLNTVAEVPLPASLYASAGDKVQRACLARS